MNVSREAMPASVAEVADALRAATADSHRVTVAGGGTHLAFGRSNEPPDVVLRTTALNRVVEYVPHDMTIAVEAGMTIADLSSLLARHRCRLPLDVEDPRTSTIGGVIAFGIAGPRRLGMGTLRDYLIGARIALADGTLVKTGGMVVKNVSGYDLTRMLHGSMGSLGVMTSLNFKLAPMPAEQSTVPFDFGDASLALATAAALLASRLPFAALQADSSGTLRVGCDGHAADAARLRAGARNAALVRGGTEGDTLEGERAVAEAWRASAAAPFGGRTVTLRVTSTPSRVAGDVERTVRAAGRLDREARWTADAGSSTIELSMETSSGTEGAEGAEEVARLERLIDALADLSPSVRVTRCPLEMRPGLALFGRAPSSARILRLVKSQFDPQRVLAGDAFAAAGVTHG